MTPSDNVPLVVESCKVVPNESGVEKGRCSMALAKHINIFKAWWKCLSATGSISCRGYVRASRLYRVEIQGQRGRTEWLLRVGVST